MRTGNGRRRSGAAAPAEMALLDRAGNVVAVNQPWRDFYRANGGDDYRCGVGMSYLAACDRADDPVTVEVGAAIRSAVAGDLPVPRRIRVPCESGEQGTLWFDTTIASRFADDGECLGATVTFTELSPVLDGTVTALGDASWGLIETLPDGLLITEADGRIVYLNRQLETVTGYCRDELLGQPVEVLVPDGVRDKHHRLRADFSEAPSHRWLGSGSELTLRRRDGVALPAEISLAPMMVGGVLMTAATVRDVAARRRDDLHRRRLLHLLDLVPDAVFVVDAESMRVEYANAAAADLLGYHRDELTGKPYREIHPQETDEQRRARFASLPIRRSDPITIHETVARHHDGTEIPVESHLLMAAQDDGERRVLVVSRDIRQRRELERHRAQRAAVAAVVAEVTTAVLARRPLAEVYQQVAEGVAGVFGAERVTLSFPGQRSRRLAVVATAGERTSANNTAPSATPTSTANPSATPARGTKGPAATVRFGPAGPEAGQVTAIRGKDGPSFHDTEIDLLTELTGQLALAIELGRARADQERLAVLEDRHRIARDLHDTVIQDLIALGIQLNRRAAQTQPDRELIERMEDAVRRLRAVVFQLRDHPHGLSVSDTITAVAAEAARALGHPPTVTMRGPVDALDTPTAEQVLTVLREALSNVARHAKASSTVIELVREARRLRLTVKDDGCGLRSTARRSSDSGLANIRHRAEALGGQARFTRPADGGTLLTWTCPLPPTGDA